MPNKILNHDDSYYISKIKQLCPDDNMKGWNLFNSTDIYTVKAAEGEQAEIKIGDIINIEGYLSTFKNVDRENDVVVVGAFDEALKAQKVYPLQKNHSYDTDSQMGDFKAKVDDKGLYIKAEILVTPNNIHEAMLIKAGKLSTLSMGGAFKYSETKNKKGNNLIEKVALWEGSVVSIPANPKAKFESKELIIENPDPIDESEDESKEKVLSIAEKAQLVKKIIGGK